MASTDVEPTTTTPSAHSANDLQGAKSQTAPPCDGHERTAETAEPILIDLDAAPRLNKIIPTEPTSFQVWLVLKFIAQAAAQRADILEMLYKLRTGEHKVANGNTKGALIALREDGCVEFLLVNGRGVVKITELGLRRESAYAAAQANARSEHEAKQAAAQNEWEEMTRRDRLEFAWESIYISMPVNGPIDYVAWGQNIMAFCEAVTRDGVAALFLEFKPADENDRTALSVIQAGLTGGANAMADLLAELSKSGDCGWMRVFNHSALFWRIINADPEHERLIDGEVDRLQCEVPPLSMPAQRIDGTLASRLANTFAAALTIAEVLKPIKEIGVVSDPSSVYSSMRIPLRALEEGLCHASPWEGRLHPAVDNELRVLRQLCLHIQTRCPTYGDVCQFLAGSDLEGAARRGWSAMMALDKGVDPSTNSRDNAIVVRAPDLPTEIPDVGTVDASLDARQHSSVNVTNEKLASVTNAPQNAAPRIPPENRTRPLTLRAAATLLGYQGNRKRRAKQLKNLIDVNAIAFEQLTRQSYVFDRNSFPKESWPKLLPT